MSKRIARIEAEFYSAETKQFISSSVTEDEINDIIFILNEYKDEGYIYNVSSETLYIYGPDSWDDPGEPVYEIGRLKYNHNDYTIKITDA